MALTVEQLQAERDAIIQQLDNAQTVQSGDKSVTFRPVVELEAALARVDAELAALQSPQPRQFTIQTSRGL